MSHRAWAAARLSVVLPLVTCLLVSACGSSSSPSTSSALPAEASTLIAGGWTREELIDLFEYEPLAESDVEEQSVEEREGAAIHDISYVGAGSLDRVSAYLVVPPGEGPFAGVVFMHWGGGSKSSFLEEAIGLAQRGCVSLLVNVPFIRDSGYFIDAVRSLRRGTDLLSGRPDVDATRLGYVGHSWGATFGAILADVDRRFATYVLMAGVPSFSEFWDSEQMTPLDGIHYIGNAAPASLFFQYAEHDANVTHDMSMRFYEAGSEPKQIDGYDTTHRFADEQASSDRVDWLSVELALP